jgi:predicted nucleic acid-binding protein
MIGANQITDHYLVALARHHHLTLVTFDEALARAFGSDSALVQLAR